MLRDAVLTPAPPSAPPPDKAVVVAGGWSGAGTKPDNQDAFAVRLPRTPGEGRHKGVAACVADGLSSTPGAAAASGLAVTQFLSDYAASPATWSVREAGQRSLVALNAWLFRQGHASGRPGATTFTGVVLKSRTLHHFQVGDSALFLLRDGRLRRLTHEHRLRSGGADVLTAALGADAQPTLTYDSLLAEEGDLYCLVTDGVADAVADAALTERLRRVGDDLDAAARTLCEASVEAGSTDNVTAVLLRVETLPSRSVVERETADEGRAFLPALVPGQAVDGLEVVRVLHDGVRSRVYRVRSRENGEVFVLKAPTERFEEDPGYLAAFAREAWLGQQVRSRSAMRTFPQEESSPYLYLLCEPVDGQSLRQWMHDHPLPSLTAVRDVVHQVVTAVRTLHRMGVVHRDLKPENLMVRPDGTVTVIDYGSVSIAGLEDIAPAERQGQGEGSLGYAAPEFVLGDPATRVSDLFSIAAITYEMLTGSLPYRGDLGAHGRPGSLEAWRYTPARGRRGDLPAFVDAALEAALAPDPARRSQALSEFEADLSRPGPLARRRASSPALIERNPVLFWQLLCALQLVLIVFLWATR